MSYEFIKVEKREHLTIITINRPEVYFGEATSNYVIVNTSEDEFNYPKGDQNVYTRYEGPDGVRMGSVLRRLVFASYLASQSLIVAVVVEQIQVLLGT